MFVINYQHGQKIIQMKKEVIIFMPSIEGGGVEKNLFLVSNYLAKRIKSLRVITISKKYKKKFSKSVKLISLESDIWDNFSRRIKYFLSIVLLINEILKNKNIVVMSFQANIYCILICKLFSIKVISRSNSAPIGWSQNFFKKKIFGIGLKLADKIIVNSIEFKRDLKKEFNVNATCIYNPLNRNEILTKSKKKSVRIFKTKDKLRILNIGRFTDQKDQLTLLKSLNNLKNDIGFEACIVGRGKLKKKLQKYVAINDLNNFVKIIDYVDNPYPLIKQTNLFVLSSKFEGLPNVLLESLVLKKFIISSDCRTGPKEILLDGKGGFLFNVGDYKMLEKRIKYFFLNKTKCQKMMINSYKSLKRFDFNKNLKMYLELLKS